MRSPNGHKKWLPRWRGIESSTFLVSCRVPPLVAENEEMVWSDLSLGEPEPFKSEVNREVGKAVSALTGKTVDFKRPDITALLDPATGMVDIQVSSILFYTQVPNSSAASRRPTGTVGPAKGRL